MAKEGHYAREGATQAEPCPPGSFQPVCVFLILKIKSVHMRSVTTAQIHLFRPAREPLSLGQRGKQVVLLPSFYSWLTLQYYVFPWPFFFYLHLESGPVCLQGMPVRDLLQLHWPGRTLGLPQRKLLPSWQYPAPSLPSGKMFKTEIVPLLKKSTGKTRKGNSHPPQLKKIIHSRTMHLWW